MKPCPSCARRIQDAASKCHYCGAIVRPPRAAGTNQTDKPAPPAQKEGPAVPMAFRIAIAILVFGAGMAWLVW
jgi:hypothetical protein